MNSNTSKRIAAGAATVIAASLPHTRRTVRTRGCAPAPRTMLSALLRHRRPT